MRRYLATAALVMLAAIGAARADGPLLPPGPRAVAACAGGNSVLGYTSYGSPLVCGTALASGSIANGVAQLGIYIGTNTIGPLTIGGGSDVTFSGSAFTVTGVQGRSASSAAPSLNQVFQWNGSSWIPSTLTFSGDASGAYPALSVTRIQGIPWSSTAPTTGQVPVYNGTAWAPGSAPGGGGGGGSVPGGGVGTLQYNNNGALGGYGIGPSFSVDSGGNFVLAAGAAAFNIGNLGGDLFGTLPNPTIAVGAASRSVGNLGGGLSGTLPNPTLNASAVVTALGSPAGDLGGSSYAAPSVVKLQGNPIDSTPPTPQASLVWNGSAYTPTVLSPGINQGVGDVLFGPGTGAQTTTINAGVVTNQKLANQQAQTVKCNSGAAAGVPADCPVTGGLAFSSGALQLAPLGPSLSKTVGTDCWIINNGIVSAITAGVCAGSVVLTADDGATALTADDASTQLTAEGGTAPTACASNLKLQMNLVTGCNAIAVAAAMR